MYQDLSIFKVSAHAQSITSMQDSLDDTGLLLSSLAPSASSQSNWEKDGICL